MASILSFVRDGFANLMTGRGTTADKSVHGGYYLRPLSAQEIEAAYRSSWLMRKAVDRPANDMTRAWRDWQADKEQITALEAEEKRLGLRDKIKRAVILGRLGGGALILGVPGATRCCRSTARAFGKGALRYLHVVSRSPDHARPARAGPGERPLRPARLFRAERPAASG
jgi:hypothetical protein